jgi:NAD(P)H-flavin reductase
MKLLLNLILYFVPFVLGSFINNRNIDISSLYNSENTTINNYQNLTYHNSISVHVHNKIKLLEITDSKNNFFKIFDVPGLDIIISSYTFFILSSTISLIIFKCNLMSCFLLSKKEVCNYMQNSYTILLITYIIWWTSILVYSFFGDYRGEIMIRLGNWITLNLASTLLPISRNSIFVILFDMSHYELLFIHKVLSCLCLLSVVIKFITVLVLYESSFLIMVKYTRSNGSPLMGTIATILFIICATLSMPIIRKNYFELFYYSHRILSISILLVGSLHYISFIYYISPVLSLYIIDIILRLYHTNSSIYLKVKNKGIEKYETDCTFIDITFQKKIKTYPGCYFFICFYKDISRSEWHPLSMILYTHDTIRFCTKNNGKHTWTGKLFDTVNNNKILTNSKVYIQGPYGRLTVKYENNVYKNIVIICGGIGVTPMFSILEDINDLYEKNKLPNLKKVYFYWVMKHISLYDAFKKYFIKLNKDIFDIKIYTTNYKVDDYFDTEDNSITFIKEKPNIIYILNMLFSNNNKNICVVTCGPAKLTNEILDVCNHFNVDISVENF